MKKFITLTVFTVATLIALNTIAQPMVKKMALDNSYILTQAERVKTANAKDGFSLSKATNMVMESNNELPVILSFTEGITYRIVFIGENTSSASEMKLMDFNDNQITSKKSNGEGNVISYDYTSKTTQYHMIKPVQTNDSKAQLSGYFMIFKKD